MTKKNDYCQHFVNTNERPQNFIMNIKPEERFIEYPKLKELIKMKDDLITKRNHPLQMIQADLKDYDLKQLGKFDVILLDPPWQEYYDRVQSLPILEHNTAKLTPWSLSEIQQLPIGEISETPSFLFLWVGSEHLEHGRELFKKWGYKRCEDIVWVKMNKHQSKHDKNLQRKNTATVLQRVKEHCLVGLRGDVKRASDSHFIHANIDTDVIVDEEPALGSTQKPKEIYDIIERFCLGRKRIELFGETTSLRAGWLTVGEFLPETNFNLEEYNSWFEGDASFPNTNFMGGRYVGTTSEIENLRPKSPTKSGQQQNQKQNNQNNDKNNNEKNQEYQQQSQQQPQHQRMDEFQNNPQFIYSSQKLSPNSNQQMEQRQYNQNQNIGQQQMYNNQN